MKAHLASTYQTGDPAEAMVEVPPAICAICGRLIDPLLGKTLRGTDVRYDVWVEGSYEHRERPAIVHPAVAALPATPYNIRPRKLVSC